MAFAYLTTEVSSDAPARLCRRRCLDRPGHGPRLDLAGDGARADRVLVRPRASLRSWAAPRDRHRRRQGRLGRRSGFGHRVVRRHGPGRRQDRHDPDHGWVLGHARASRLLRGAPRGTARGGRCRRNRRAERRAGTRRALRVSRDPYDHRGTGLPRSAALPAFAGVRSRGTARRRRRRGCSSACVRARGGAAFGPARRDCRSRRAASPTECTSPAAPITPRRGARHAAAATARAG
jgi:hypothetical protein